MDDGTWHLQLVKRMMHSEPTREDSDRYVPAITCILPMAQVVYTGDEDGKVVSLSLPFPFIIDEVLSRIKSVS